MYPRVDVRSSIVGMIGRKCNMTSFSNTLDVKFIKLKEKAHKSTQSNREATENIWETLTRLLQNVGGFLVYLAILSSLNWCCWGDRRDLRGGISGVPVFQQLDFPAPG